MNNAKITPKDTPKPSKLICNCELFVSPKNHHKQGNHQTKPLELQFLRLQEDKNCTQSSNLKTKITKFLTEKLKDLTGTGVTNDTRVANLLRDPGRAQLSKSRLIGLSLIPFQQVGGLELSFSIFEVAKLVNKI